MQTGKGERRTRCLRVASVLCFLLSIFGVNPVVAPVRALAQMPVAPDGRGTAPVNEEEELHTHHKSRSASQEWHRPSGKQTIEAAVAPSSSGRQAALSLNISYPHEQDPAAAIGSGRLRC
jgi:hypothetical protein